LKKFLKTYIKLLFILMAESKLNNNKIYFIASNRSILDRKLEYYFDDKKIFKNLKKVYSFKKQYKNQEFIISIFSFDFDIANLKYIKKDINMNKYKLMIKLKRLDYLSEHKGIIFFNENKNNFIYNFRFGNSSFYSAPIEIDFTNFELLQIYIKFIDNLNIINKENLISDLFDDSKQFLINKNSYYFDFYLELFKLFYNKKEIKDILIIFDLNKVELPVKFHDNNYTKFLFLIEEKKDVIIKFCEKNDNIEKYYTKFYSILLYFLKNYEKEKFSSFLYRKDL
jgi:hypothetical protein